MDGMRPKTMCKSELVAALEMILSAVQNGESTYGALDYEQFHEGYAVKAVWQLGMEGVLMIQDGG